MHVKWSLHCRFLIAWAGILASHWALAQTEAPQGAAPLALFEQARAYEHGEGVPRDPLQAASLYCQAARLGLGEAQFNLGWMYANGRGLTRDDAMAAYFFQAAAEQGLAVAQRMLKVVGEPSAVVPECMRDDPVPVAPVPKIAPVVKVTPPKDYTTIAPRSIFDLVNKLAPQFQVEPQLALAIIAAESNFNTLAISSKNAQGLMQLIPETSARFNVKNAFDPVQNIRGGLTYLRWLLAYFEGDVSLVAAAYNAGEGTVEHYLGVPPYTETRSYVQRIVSAFGAQLHPFESKITAPSARFKK
jgi:hypothetical protein